MPYFEQIRSPIGQMCIRDRLFQMIIENPANYLSYYIGYQEFYELLTDYKKMAGNKYSLKAYHTEILDAGPCSFDILRRRIESNL